jgi:hypothetical protein
MIAALRRRIRSRRPNQALAEKLAGMERDYERRLAEASRTA